MTPDRCPHCRAALAPGAQWCSLCYADLRVREPEPVVAPVLEPVLVPAGEGSTESASAAAPAAAPPGSDGARAAGWPCLSCGALVPMDENFCTQCGASFLPPDAELDVPWVGDPRRLSTGAKAGIMIGGTVLVMAVLLLVLLVGGSII